MNWHRDKEVNRAFIGLMDALVSWERNTGRSSKLLFIPDADDEEIIFLMDGKPVSHTPFLIVNQLDMIKTRLVIKFGLQSSERKQGEP